MGTEVLRPQDFLTERFRISSPAPFYHRRKNHFVNGNGYQKKKFNHHQHHRHQEVANPKRFFGAGDDFKPAGHSRSDSSHKGNGPVVTILRRGESLDSLNSKIKKEAKRMPSPEIEERKADVYAGSAFSVSPSPSSLPLPTFCRKQELKSFDDSATRDLRRLLRLD